MASVGDSEGIFKVPAKPAPKSTGRTVMEEDAFIAEMEKIIESDFFPDLKSLRLKNEYLEAMDAKDYDRMRRAYINLKRHREGKNKSRKTDDSSVPSTPTNFGETPASRRSDYSEFDAEDVALGFMEETPHRVKTVGGDQTPRSAAEMEHPLAVILRRDVEDELEKKRKKLGLDAFLSEHVSEDTESFRMLMEKTEAERRHKKAWMFDPPSKPGETTQEIRLALPSAESQSDQNNRPTNLDSDLCPVYNAVMFVPDSKALTGKERLAMERPVIRHDSTRLKVNPYVTVGKNDKEANVLYKRTGMKGEKIGVDGRVENEDVDDAEKAATGAPKFNFISTPRIRPDDIGSPLMTWGHLAGTPLLLEGPSRAGTPAFRMAPTPKRDRLADKLVQQAKASAQQASRATTPRIGSKHKGSSFMDSPAAKRLGSMSPAAHALMTRKLGITPRLGRGSVTPKTPSTPKHPSLSRTPTPRRAVGVNLTPKHNSSKRDEAAAPKLPALRRETDLSIDPSLTDNLLNLPAMGS